MNPDLFNRYLRLLNLTREEPSLAALNRVVTAHLTCIPFENISKLFYLKNKQLKWIPSFEEYLDGVEYKNFGGTCYSSNYYLNRLLNHLGYQANLCGAAMQNPNSHMLNNIKLGGKQFLVDVGYAAPFVRALPRSSENVVRINWGFNTYVLSPQDKMGRSHLAHLRYGEQVHEYLMSPVPRELNDFKSVISNSFMEDSKFLNEVIVVKFGYKKSISIRNDFITMIDANEIIRTQINSKEQLIDAIHKEIGITKEIIEIALN